MYVYMDSLFRNWKIVIYTYYTTYTTFIPKKQDRYLKSLLVNRDVITSSETILNEDVIVNARTKEEQGRKV